MKVNEINKTLVDKKKNYILSCNPLCLQSTRNLFAEFPLPEVPTPCLLYLPGQLKSYPSGLISNKELLLHISITFTVPVRLLT